MRVQTVSELQPVFNKPKVFLAPCQCQLLFFKICLYTFLILFCPLQSCDNRNRNNHIHFSILPKANTCWCRPFCLLIPPLAPPGAMTHLRVEVRRSSVTLAAQSGALPLAASPALGCPESVSLFIVDFFITLMSHLRQLRGAGSPPPGPLFKGQRCTAGIAVETHIHLTSTHKFASFVRPQ